MHKSARHDHGRRVGGVPRCLRLVHSARERHRHLLPHGRVGHPHAHRDVDLRLEHRVLLLPDRLGPLCRARRGQLRGRLRDRHDCDHRHELDPTRADEHDPRGLARLLHGRPAVPGDRSATITTATDTVAAAAIATASGCRTTAGSTAGRPGVRAGHGRRRLLCGLRRCQLRLDAVHLLRLDLTNGAGHGALRRGHRPKPAHDHRRRHERQLGSRRRRHLRAVRNRPVGLRQLGRHQHEIPEDGHGPALRCLGGRLRAGHSRQVLCMRRRGRRRGRLLLRPRHRGTGAVGFWEQRSLRRLKLKRLRSRIARVFDQRVGRQSWCAGLLPGGATGPRLRDQPCLVRQRGGHQGGALPVRHLLRLRRLWLPVDRSGRQRV